MKTSNDTYDDEDLSSVFGGDDDEDSLIDEKLNMSLSEPSFIGADEEAHETKDLLKRVRKETRRVTYWRVLVTLAILGTAAAVTGVTYKSLKKEEDYNFETAFQQFARTVGDAAVEARQDLRQAYRQFAETITSLSESSGATWPLYTPPLYQQYAQNFLTQSRTELISLRPIVHRYEKEAWENYTAYHHEQVVEEAHAIKFGNLERLDKDPEKFLPYMWQRTPDKKRIPDVERDYYLPTLATSPPGRDYGSFNWNIASHASYQSIVEAALALRNETLITSVRPYVGPAKTFLVPEEHAKMHDELPADVTDDHPHSFFFFPVQQSIQDPGSKVVAMLCGAAPWDQSMRGLLPEGVHGILAVVYNNCGQNFTYQIDGPVATFRGMNDFHDPKYDHLVHEVDLAFHSHPAFDATPGHCQYGLRVYPTEAFEDEYHTMTPLIQAIVVAGTFAVIALTFVVYDIMVAHRNNKLITDAARTNALVSQLFPGDMANKMMNRRSANKKDQESLEKFMRKNHDAPMEDFSSGSGESNKPLAELYLEASVMFADIVGFTAWSSVRSPDQVFELLETCYRHFDAIAKRRQIFKVETIGDCYVAAAGLPVPRKDHALMMARFARDIMNRMHLLAKKLEERLGPDTGELDLRIGIHAGSVTAGVLRGERARFQLFGDTMNTTARLESSGQAGKILVSREYANLLLAAGKSSWLEERTDLITAKGKGKLQSFWLLGASSGDRRSVGSVGTQGTGERELYECGNRKERLVDWCCQIMEGLLKQIIARRKAAMKSSRRSRSSIKPHKYGSNFFEEVKEVIMLPEYDPDVEARQCSPDEIELDFAVREELKTFVTEIAGMYNENWFHNFEHASHVLMSVVKLMGRIVAPKQGVADENTLHDHTYGITSDPLTQFACAFSALIHDVDHVGVGNAQLLKEKAPIAQKYEKSCAEQNSLELSWKLLMDSRFERLRSTIYSTSREESRFRSLVVNSVMATDIVDKELKELRNGRWAKAFKEEETASEVFEIENNNRKATIVIEHLIQASDVSHMMQHWHVYRKWNTLFFQECYQAFVEGRAEKDPSEFWYKGEIGFFDFYIIPLAKKLKECGVFGVSSGEYLEYAQKNRDEWVQHGEEAVAEMVRLVKGGQTSGGFTQDLGIPGSIEC